MTRRRIVFLVAAAVTAAAGCGRQAAPRADFMQTMLLYLSRYGKFAPAEAKQIAEQINRGPRDLAVQVAAAGREGILLKPGELQPALPPPGRNAAPIYVQLAGLLKTRPLDPATARVMSSLGVRVWHSPEEVEAVRQMLAERQDAMALAHAAASEPQCVFQRDWSRGMLLEFPENATMREAARLISAESYFLAQGGRYREAVADEAQVFRIAQHPTAEPILISQLVGMACDAIALAGMENMLCLAGPRPEVAVAVRAAVATHRPHFPLRRTLEGEIVFYSLSMNGLRRDAPVTDATHRRLKQLYGSGSRAVDPDTAQKYPLRGHPFTNHLLDAAQADYLRLMRTLIAASGQPYVRSRPLLARLRRVADTQPRNPVEQLASFGAIAGQVITHATQARAQEDAIIAGAAVLAYRGRHGAFPARLEQAMRRPPLDRFGAGPLRYRREGDGFVVYSIGPDGNFDGSRPGLRRVRDQAYFRYPATPLLPQRN